MEKGERVTFASFEGGIPRGLEGSLVSVDAEFVTVAFEEKHYRFRRQPGSKSGWGVGPASKWRLGLAERSRYCIADQPRRR